MLTCLVCPSIFLRAGEGGDAPPPPKASKQIEVVPGRNQYEIRWPNLLRVETVLKPTLTIDWDQVKPLTIDPSQTPIYAEIAPALAGYANLDQVSTIDLEKAAGEFRLQRLIFRAARKLYLQNEETFSGDKQYLAVQLIRLVETFLTGDKLDIPSLSPGAGAAAHTGCHEHGSDRGPCEPVCAIAEYGIPFALF